MKIPEYTVEDNHLSIEKFREMDYLALERFHLPVELMMENAGLHLARLVVHLLPSKGDVLIGIGPGNNGGGGLVAARRLAAWGYRVSLDIPVPGLGELPRKQLERTLAVGGVPDPMDDPGIFVDAYLGFSQRLPLSAVIQQSLDRANMLTCKKISLDIPTGFNKETGVVIFKPDAILTLAAMKSELLPLAEEAEIYLADLGVPGTIYNHYGIDQPSPFKISGLLRCRI